MAVTLTQKQEMVSELMALAGESISAVAAHNGGMSVSEMTELRQAARKSRVTMRIYRNTLARRALKDTSFSCLDKALVGPIVLFFAHDEPGAAARVLRDFIKSNDKIVVKALAMDGNLLAPSQLAVVASLPSRDEAIARLMSQMLAPITQLTRTINEPVAQLVRAVAAIGDKK